jgi:cobalt-zinc-cadmium efflux system protein
VEPAGKKDVLMHCPSHGHGHDHTHSAAATAGWRFGLATGLNLTLVAAQIIYGLAANSVALLADAGHNFGDIMGLGLAWGAAALATRKPTPRFTYGFRSASIMAALANAMLLLLATGIILREALAHFSDPRPVAAVPVMVVAGVGVLINGLSAWLLMGNAKDINVRGAFLHLLADAAVSLGVMLGGGLILFTGKQWIDPAISVVISLVIVWGSWGMLREAVKLSLQGVPAAVDPHRVRAYIERQPGVTAVHDLHIWAMSTTEIALTCHLVMPDGHPGDSFLHGLAHDLQHRFGVGHCTMQVEITLTECALAPEDVV